MAHSASAKKRIRQSEKKTAHNRAAKAAIRTHAKRVLAAVEAGDRAKAEAELRVTTKKIDKAAQRGILHRNTAARQKSDLSRKVAAMGAV
jgi:small subunit ribosomal protein S20